MHVSRALRAANPFCDSLRSPVSEIAAKFTPIRCRHRSPVVYKYYGRGSTGGGGRPRAATTL